MTPVERMARAIYTRRWPNDNPDEATPYQIAECRADARVALAAIREPTLAMIVAGEACDDWDFWHAGCEVHYMTMIDAALAESPAR